MDKKEYKYSVYTPTNISHLLVDKALTLYFSSEESEEKLKNLRVCDLSCGTGSLLIPMLERLIIFSKELTGKYLYNSSWIEGYDINKEAVNITKLKIKEILKKYSLDGEINIHCEDGLFLKEKSYNIILGNPPYLGEKNNKEIFQKIKYTDFGKKYYEGKMDYFYFFIEKAVELLQKDGVMVYLTTNYWLKADSGKKLRECLKRNGNFQEMLIYDTSLFIKAVGQHNIIFSWRKSKEKSKVLVILPTQKFYIYNSEIYDSKNKIILADKKSMEYNKKMELVSNYKLGDLVNINQGIVSGCDQAFIFKEFKEEYKEYLKPFYKNKDIGKYKNEKNKFWILYLDKNTLLTEEIERYLKTYYEKLVKRREVKNGRINWWQLQWAREKKIFSEPKILVRQRCKTNQFSYDNTEFYGSADIYFITVKKSEIDIFYILGYMNSSTFLEWFKYNGKSKGKNYEFYSTPLKETPIYYSPIKEERDYISNLVKRQITEYNEETQKKIDEYFENVFK